MSKKAYIFQSGSLIIPAGNPDEEAANELDSALIESSFNLSEYCIDRFTVPSLTGGEDTEIYILGECSIDPSWKLLPVRQLMGILSKGKMVESAGPLGKIFRVHHLLQWRRDSIYCGKCGSLNKDTENAEMARQCTSCGRLEFPRISPAVITIVINDRDEALLAHNKNFTNGMYSLIAGFNEAGESLEDTVEREIREEVNIEVKDIRYIKSQAWPFPNSLMLGFTARHSSGDLTPDGVEIEDAKWFTRDNLPLIPGYGSVSRHLIDLWINGQLSDSK